MLAQEKKHRPMKHFRNRPTHIQLIWFVTKAMEQCTEDTESLRFLLFNKVKVCGNLAFISVTFPTAFAHFVSVLHFSNCYNISYCFLYCSIYYGDLWSCMLLLPKDYDSLNVKMMVRDFFCNIKWRCVHLFRHNAI